MPFKNPHPLYSVWMSMKGRCQNPNYRQWKDYGGRGISVCERWQSDFHAFVADMGPRPPGYSLDRIDNDKGYSPENCRWASRKEQQKNTRLVRFVEIEGVRYKAVEIAQRAGLKTDTVIERAARGLSYKQVCATEKLHNLSGLALGGRVSGAKLRSRTHCRRGHELTPENTHYIAKYNARSCRKCKTKAGKLDPVLRGLGQS